MYDVLIQEYDGSFGNGRTVDDIVNCVEDLPPMPDVITQAIALIDDADTTAEDMAGVIGRDPILTSSILRLANSADMGQQQEVTSLSTAILQVGMGKIKSMLYASAVRALNRNFGPVERLVWEKSLGAASAAHVICTQVKKRYRDELYLTGLLHNLGQVVFLSNKEIAPTYARVLGRVIAHSEPLAAAEREVIGFSHPLVGALVARQWKLPLSTCQAILHCADPFEGIGDEQDEKLAVLKLATGIGMTADFGRPAGHPMDLEELDTLAKVVGFRKGAMDSEDFDEALRGTKERFATESSAYGRN